MDLIQNSVFEVFQNKFDINIISDFKTKDLDNKENHPLLDKIKEKFDGGAI